MGQAHDFWTTLNNKFDFSQKITGTMKENIVDSQKFVMSHIEKIENVPASNPTLRLIP